MSDYFFSEKNLRPRSALEVAILARAKEKQMALLEAEIGAEEARATNAPRSSLKRVLTGLLAIIVK